MDLVDETPEDQPDNETGEPAPEAPANDPADNVIEAINILPALVKAKPEWVKKVSARAVSAAIEDNESRADFMKRYANQLKLFAGVVKDFGYPAQGAKAPHIAIMCKAILHLWARIYDQVVPAKGDIVKGSALGPADLARAERVEKHMNWQLRHRMPEWSTGILFTILGWLLAGSRFRAYRWDPIAHTHVIDDLPMDDIIISYTETDQSPQMKNVERVTRVRRMARWEIEKYAAAGFFSNIDAIFPDLKDPDAPDDTESGSTTDGDSLPTTEEDDSPVREAADKVGGVEPPKTKSKYAKREIYEQHTFLAFPKGIGIDGLDGETKPVIITVDKKTKKPLAITIREEPDAVDQERFNQETAAYQQAVQNIQQTAAQAPQQLDESGAPIPAPTPPAPKKPRPVRMQTVYRIIHFGLFPNPEGFYRLGVGYLLEGSNELANALAGEYTLTAKFQNLITGFMARGTKEKRGDIQVNHGKIMETDLEPEFLDKAIKLIEFHPPSEGLMNVVAKLEENSEIAASADILSGEKGSSNETAKGTAIRNANAMSLISVMTRLFLDPLKYELKLIAHANSIYLDESEYFPFVSLVPDLMGKPQIENIQVFRADYVEDVHLEFTADARVTSKPERISDAKDALQMILTSPLQENVQLVDFAMRKYFEVSDGFDYLAKMGPPPQPPQPPPPPTPQSQDTENAGFFNEKDHPVLPDDNHVAHLHRINELKQSPLHEHMSSTGKQLLDRHERAHVAQFYLQLQAEQERTGIPIHELAKQVGLGRVAPGPPGATAAGGPGTQAPGGNVPVEANGAPG